MRNPQMEAARRDKAALLGELEKAGGTIKGKSVCCPFHHDKNPSGGVWQGEDGAWRYTCQTPSCAFSGDIYDVMARAQGRTAAEVLQEQSPHQSPPREQQEPPKVKTLDGWKKHFGASLEDVHTYTSPDTGEPDLVVFRCRKKDGKFFVPTHPCPEGLRTGYAPGKRPLYNRARGLKADTIIVVEGEKCVHALHRLGVTATTSPSGAGAAEHADWSWVAGKTVYLWPDRDEDGLRYMRNVQTILADLVPAVRLFWIDPDQLDLPVKADAADYIEAMEGSSAQEKRYAIDAVMATAAPLGASAQLGDFFEGVIAGQLKELRWPWPVLTQWATALIPGTTTLLCGQPGGGKSWLLIEAAAYWMRSGVRCAIYEVEDSLNFHMHRAIAQAEGDARLTRLDWVRQHPDEVRRVHEKHAGFIDAFGACVTVRPADEVTLPGLTRWVEQKLMARCEIVAIDTVTGAAATEQAWVTDHKFIMDVKALADQYEARVILCTHPKKDTKVIGLNDLAGGASYARLLHTVLWLEPHFVPKAYSVFSKAGLAQYEVNRVVRVLKTRHGPGAGARVAFGFDDTTLRFHEYGLIKETPK